MGFFELLMIAVGLSMDAFAVSLSKGLGMKKLSYSQMAVIAGFFGGFQAAMPLIGFLLGRQFERYITRFDHWVAFVLLTFIGAKMIREAFTGAGENGDCEKPFSIREVFLLALATSIDALAAGITFAFFNVDILPSIGLIGCTTFIISAAGVVVGHQFGARFKEKAEAAGGAILILIGLKILLDHLGLL